MPKAGPSATAPRSLPSAPFVVHRPPVSQSAHILASPRALKCPGGDMTVPSRSGLG